MQSRPPRVGLHGPWAHSFRTSRGTPCSSLQDYVTGSDSCVVVSRLEDSIHERRPDRPWRDGVAADVFVAYDLVAQGTHEANHGTLRCRVIDELWVADGHVYRCVEGDRGALFEMRDGSLCYRGRAYGQKGGDRGSYLAEVEERVDIGVEDFVPLFGGKCGKVFVRVLCSMVQNAESR